MIDENQVINRKEKFINDYLPKKSYYKHSDVDLFLSIDLTSIFNYENILSEEQKKFIIEHSFKNDADLIEKINKKKVEEWDRLLNEKRRLLKENGIERYWVLEKPPLQEISTTPGTNPNTISTSTNNSLTNSMMKPTISGPIDEGNNLPVKNILLYNFPEFEIYCVAQLYVEGTKYEPECQTKLLFNKYEMHQTIAMRFKYEELTPDSFIVMKVYSMQLPKGQNCLGTAKIDLFDEFLNLRHGRHVFRVYKGDLNNITKSFNPDEIEKEKFITKLNNRIDNNSKDKNAKVEKIDKNKEIKIYDDNVEKYKKIEEELDILVNTYYKPKSNQIQINNDNTMSKKDFNEYEEKYKKIKKNGKEILNNIAVFPLKKAVCIKTNFMKNYEFKLNELLDSTPHTFVEIAFPTFKYPVIYEEVISKNSNEILNYSDCKSFRFNVSDIPFKYDTNIFKYKAKNINAENNFMDYDNPIMEKFSSLVRANDDVFAKDIRLTKNERIKINALLNIPDFIELRDNEKALFWTYRYELLKNDTKFALTKIMNSVDWGGTKSETEFVKNILYQWKTIEMCDILYMLSRKFSINTKIYSNLDNKVNNLDAMKDVRKFAVKKLGEFADKDLNFILLQLVQAIRYEDITKKNVQSPLVSFLVDRCGKNLELATNFYWFIACETDKSDLEDPKNKKSTQEEQAIIFMIEIYTKILKLFETDLQTKNTEIYNIIMKEKAFKDDLVYISDTLSHVKGKVDEKKKELREKILVSGKKHAAMQEEEQILPLNPNIRIRGTIPKECTVFKSAKCPVKYTFKVIDDYQKYNNQTLKNLFKIMFKYGDDLRQDQLILQIILYMDSLLKENHLDFEFTTYKVLASSKTDGFVEFVDNSKTIKDILDDKKKYKSELKNYIMDGLDEKKDKETWKKRLDSYINSCAGYAVATYILGIGDRHLENLMIINNGKLFHIDFGYILGKDPKPAPPPIKLCKQMVDCMGGENSETYEIFKRKCVDAYWILRESARMIVDMFYLMIDSGIPEINNIDNLKKLNDKFKTEYNKEDAKNNFINNLEESVKALMPVIMDKIHAWAVYWK